MQRKTIFAVLLVIALLVASVPMPIMAQESESLSIWITGNESEVGILQTAAAPFTEDTGIEVTVEAVSWGDAFARYLSAINSGEGADIYIGGMSWGISLGNIGGLVDISETFADEYEAVLEANNPSFVDGTIGVDGAVYVVPYNQDVQIMYYLTDALAEAGFDAPPATWEELTAAVEALNELGYGAGWGWGNASWLGLQPMLYQAGGAWYAEDCSTSAVNSDEGLTALEYYTTLYEDLGFPQEQANTATGFSTGELALTIDGEWTAPGINSSFPELEGTWAVAPLPEGPAGNNDSFLGGKSAGIFSYSENVDAAWQFLQWLQTAEAAEGIATEAFALGRIHLPPQPANADAIQGDEGFSSVLATQLENTTAPPSCPGWEESGNAINNVIQSVLFEGAAFDDALIEMETILNEALVEYGS